MKTFLLSFGLLVLSFNAAFCQGRISEVKNGDLFTITIIGYASQDLWLGCTVNPDSDYEVDLKPQRVSGNFSVSFNLSSGVSGSSIAEGGSVSYAVALWKEKITLKECEKKYGVGSEQCQWARKNGYQMEGRIDRKTGSY